ncbi:MAG: ceramidase domain-containing protein, partial [Bacteroidota bacterium]
MEAPQIWIPPDGGPLYCETPATYIHGVAEPWNAWSSLFILLPALYFLFKLYGQYREYAFLTVCIPLLILGGLGSTLYHANRDSTFFLYMDVVPTALLFVSISFYLWWKVLDNIWAVLLLILIGTGLSVLTYVAFSGQLATNIAYVIRGTLFFVPVIVLLRRTNYRAAALILGGIAFFCLALVFRAVDGAAEEILPMGTHFLWHVSTGIGGLLVAEYLYRMK